MRGLEVSALTVALLISVAYARPQHQHQQQIDPAYLRDYYSQIAAGARGAPTEATPIYEQDNSQNQQSQYASSGQQIRVKDPVAEQVRKEKPSGSFFLSSIHMLLLL